MASRSGATRRGGPVALLVALGLLALAPAAGASTTSVFAQGHPYRHGVVPTRGAWAAMRGSAALSANNLRFGGGISGVGVTTGPPKVYLVFWGSQWGTQGTNSAGNVTLSGDPSGMAPYVEAFMKGLGTAGELWSGVMTQYCQGVSTGAQTCPASSTQHVGYPTGGAFAGVWVDESAAEPATASGHAIGAEAVKAAGHFGNTTAALNRNAQYVIISAHGTNPDNWETAGFCAWHDYTGDSSLTGGAVSSPYGALAFTNLPYITDAGQSCGQNFVNSGTAGKLDGVSIVEGHEYAETITDQFPAGGWTDSSGAENGDKCAWISSGSGRSQNLSLATGTFAVQTTWANDGNGGSGACEVSHPIVGNGGSGCTASQLLGNPGFETGSAAPWVASAANVIEPASAGEATHSGTYDAWLGFGTATSASIQQTVTVPSGCTSYTFSFWLHVDTASTATGTSASLHVQVRNSAGTVLAVLGTFTNKNAAGGYQQHSYNLAAYAGQTIKLRFGASQSSSQRTNFVVDDAALNVS